MQNKIIRWGLVVLLGSVAVWPVTGGAEQTPAAASAVRSVQMIPVLCYHRFGPYGAKDAYSVSKAEFSGQLEIIRQEQCTPITVTELARVMRGKSELPENPVLITIDDGYRDFLSQAKPLLDQYGYPATLFIYTDFVGARLGLKKYELQALQAEGFDIGSHSVSHPKLNRLKKGETQAAWQVRMKKELAGSREKLLAWSQGEVLGMAYPYGLWNAEIAEIGQTAGYELLFTVNPGTNILSSEKKCLKRSMVLRGTRKSTFRAMLHVRDLTVMSWNPELGEVTHGSLAGINLVVERTLWPLLDPASLQATTGQTVIPTRYDTQSGKVVMTFAKPWTRGTDLIVLTARDRKGMLHYKQSRLVQVVSADE
ncbi:polysaccharide deacetylase family protein [bacterium]|nr:polysaccharide deacetylase family protein [bacterium]